MLLEQLFQKRKGLITYLSHEGHLNVLKTKLAMLEDLDTNIVK